MRKKFKLLKIAGLIAIISFAIFANGGLRLGLNNTALAVGDLSVDWGVPSPNPIFVVNNMAPGDSQERDVVVTNTAPTNRPVGVRGIFTSETGNLSTVLEIVISQNGTDLYGGSAGTKTLSQFFTDSSGPDGIFLSNHNPSQTKTYKFKVIFNEDAGNQFQDKEVIFDLQIGISIPVPEECSNIEFAGSPIFGSAKAENINGTAGNDLIFAFEGADKVEGKDGDDCIVGGIGADRLNGNNGNDVILGGDGADSLIGNNGEDRLFGEEGSDSLDGGNENDYLDGGSGADSLKGGNGEDILIGGSGADGLDGGNENDQIFGNDGADSLQGNNGDDLLDGGANADALKGGPGTDSCQNGESNNQCEVFP